MHSREAEGLGDGRDGAGVFGGVEEREAGPEPALGLRDPPEVLQGLLQLYGVPAALLLRLPQLRFEVAYPLLGQDPLRVQLLEALFGFIRCLARGPVG